jgi:hypothetical protein
MSLFQIHCPFQSLWEPFGYVPAGTRFRLQQRPVSGDRAPPRLRLHPPHHARVAPTCPPKPWRSRKGEGGKCRLLSSKCRPGRFSAQLLEPANEFGKRRLSQVSQTLWGAPTVSPPVSNCLQLSPNLPFPTSRWLASRIRKLSPVSSVSTPVGLPSARAVQGHPPLRIPSAPL